MLEAYEVSPEVWRGAGGGGVLLLVCVCTVCVCACVQCVCRICILPPRCPGLCGRNLLPLRPLGSARNSPVPMMRLGSGGACSRLVHKVAPSVEITLAFNASFFWFLFFFTQPLFSFFSSVCSSSSSSSSFLPLIFLTLLHIPFLLPHPPTCPPLPPSPPPPCQSLPLLLPCLPRHVSPLSLSSR